MVSMETICARLCLLTRAGLGADGLMPLSRATVRRMVQLGAIEGLALRSVPGVREEDYTRARALLSRSARVYAKLERVCEQGYDVLLPEDDLWPERLHAMDVTEPQFLFIRGDAALLKRRAVSVAGSREITQETAELARRCGEQIAMDGLTLVCGGARGVDTAAQHGALEAGGTLILVPAIAARELMKQSALCRALEAGRLLLVCDTWPDEPFSAQKALMRNHTIYALGDAALVIASRHGRGGSWRGAADCLRGRYTPVFAVQGEDEDMAGNRALLEMGAKPFDCGQPLDRQLFGGREDAHADRA